MHGRNKHSNATVLGGRYNSSTQAWESVRTPALQLIQRVMQSEAEAILMAFGEERYGKAAALVAGALEPDSPQPKTVWGRMLDRLLGRADRSTGSGDDPAHRPRLR